MPVIIVRLYTYGKVVGCTGDEVTVRSVEMQPRMFTFGSDADTLNADGATLVERYPPGTMAMLTVDQVAAGRQKRVVAAVPQTDFECKQLGGTVVWIGQPDKRAGKSVAVVELHGAAGGKALLTPVSRPNSSKGNRLHAITEYSGGRGYCSFDRFKCGDALKMTCFPMPAIRAGNIDVYTSLWCPPLDRIDHFVFTYELDYEPAADPRRHAAAASTSCADGASASGNVASARAGTSDVPLQPHSPLPMQTVACGAKEACGKVDAGTQLDLADDTVTSTSLAAPSASGASACSGELMKYVAELKRATMDNRALFELLHNKLDSEFMFNLMSSAE